MTQILVRMHRPFLFEVLGGQRVQYEGVPPPNAAPYGLVVRISGTSKIFTLAILGNVAGVGTPIPDLERDLENAGDGDEMSSDLAGCRIYKMSTAEIEELLARAYDTDAGYPRYDGVACGMLTLLRLNSVMDDGMAPVESSSPTP